MHTAGIRFETQRRKGGRINASDVKRIVGEVTTARSLQNPPDSILRNGFSANQFATLIETGLVWDVVH